MNQPGTETSNAKPVGKYGNFQDPIGLLKRMLLSGNRAAYDALIRAGLAVGVTPIDLLLQSRERRLLSEVSLDQSTHPQILIVGPPRSGSTLLYQTLARYADVSYLSNLSDLFPRSPLAATSLLQRRRKVGSKNFSNYYGQTAGMRAPNDGFAVWNRWLGQDRYYTPDTLSPDVEENMRRFFAAWSLGFEKPFLNKNNRNAFCLKLLAETLTESRFVIIRRDPLFVAQSLIQARMQVQGSKQRPWGLASSQNNAPSDHPLGYVDDVCDQLVRIKTRLQEQQSAIDPSRYVEVSYEAFCKDPQQELRRIADQSPSVQLDQQLMSEELSQFTVSAKMRLSKQEQAHIERRIAAVPAWHLNSKPNIVKESKAR